MNPKRIMTFKGEIRIKKAGGKLRNFQIKDNIELGLLTIPVILFFLIWHYLPMVGIILAFKNYNYVDGIFKSPWNGFKNFEFFFTSQDMVRLLRNTILYAAAFIIVDTVLALLVALFLYELRNRAFIKFYQTVMILPRFLSWVIVGFISYAFISPTMGYLNNLLVQFGIEPVDWYSQLSVWPFILLFMTAWKSIGMNSIMYYAFLMSVDRELYQAAIIDGASRFQQARYISIPALMPLISILLILSTGGLIHGDFGLFYQIPRNVGMLYPVTDVIDTYVYRGMTAGDFAMSTAIGLFQSVVGMILVIGSNLIVKKIDPEKSMF